MRTDRDLEALVAKDGLVVAKDGVRELRVKGLDEALVELALGREDLSVGLGATRDEREGGVGRLGPGCTHDLGLSRVYE